MMSSGRKAEIIRALFAAYCANDREAVEDIPHRRFPFHQSL